MAIDWSQVKWSNGADGSRIGSVNGVETYKFDRATGDAYDLAGNLVEAKRTPNASAGLLLLGESPQKIAESQARQAALAATAQPSDIVAGPREPGYTSNPPKPATNTTTVTPGSPQSGGGDIVAGPWEGGYNPAPGAGGTPSPGTGAGGTTLPGAGGTTTNASGAAQAQTALASPVSLANTTTVQGLLGQLMSQNNPLMQQARTQAQQQMASRGLLNSSMAIGAGQQALYNVAVPIAQTDASALNNTSQFNAGAQNQNSQFNTQQQNAQNQFNASQTNDLFKTQLEFENRTALANIEASYKTLMQANQSAGELYQQTLKNITDITTDPDMDAATKQSRINNQLAYLRTGMGLFEKMNNLQGLDELLQF